MVIRGVRAAVTNREGTPRPVHGTTPNALGRGAAGTFAWTRPKLTSVLSPPFPLGHQLPAGYTVLIAALGVGLHHSSVVFGTNLSIADPIAALLLVGFVASRMLVIPQSLAVAALALSASTILTSLLVATYGLTTGVAFVDVLSGYVKLLTSFVFLLLGLSVGLYGRGAILLRWFGIGGAILGTVATAYIVFPGLPRAHEFFYASFRFRGLMNDPNYYSVLAVAALTAIWKDDALNRIVKLWAVSVLVIGTLMSGSKTGAVVLFAWGVLISLQALRRRPGPSRRFEKVLLYAIALCFGVAVVYSLALSNGPSNLVSYIESNRAFNRLLPLLTDFDVAIDEQGSSRALAWGTGIGIITMSPLLGVGVGTYTALAAQLSGVGVLAHNTFIQVGAEWGLVWALIFLTWVCYVLLRRPTRSTVRDLQSWASARLVVMVMLFGSFAISLNNARILWVALGIMLGVTMKDKLSSRPER